MAWQTYEDVCKASVRLCNHCEIWGLFWPNTIGNDILLREEGMRPRCWYWIKGGDGDGLATLWEWQTNYYHEQLWMMWTPQGKYNMWRPKETWRSAEDKRLTWEKLTRSVHKQLIFVCLITLSWDKEKRFWKLFKTIFGKKRPPVKSLALQRKCSPLSLTRGKTFQTF